MPHIYFLQWLHLDDLDELADIARLASFLPLGPADLPSNPWTRGGHLFVDRAILPNIIPRFRSLLLHDDLLDKRLCEVVNLMERLAATPNDAYFLETACEPAEHNILASVLIACRRQMCMSKEVFELDGPMDCELEPSTTYSMLSFSAKFML